MLTTGPTVARGLSSVDWLTLMKIYPSRMRRGKDGYLNAFKNLLRRKSGEWLLSGFFAKAIAMRRKPSWGQERQGESCVTTITCQHYLSSPSSLSIHTSHNKSKWRGKKSNYTFHTCFYPFSFHSPLPTNLPMVYRASPMVYRTQRIRSQLVLLKTLENKLVVSKHVFFRTFQSSCPNS